MGAYAPYWHQFLCLGRKRPGGRQTATPMHYGTTATASEQYERWARGMSKSSWRKQLRDGGGNCLDFAYFLFWNFDGNGIFSNFAKDFHAKGVRTNQSAHYGKRESDDIFMKSVY